MTAIDKKLYNAYQKGGAAAVYKIANKLNPGVKKSYRVKGKLDDLAIEKTALIPMGKGDFIHHSAVGRIFQQKLVQINGQHLALQVHTVGQDFIYHPSGHPTQPVQDPHFQFQPRER